VTYRPFVTMRIAAHIWVKEQSITSFVLLKAQAILDDHYPDLDYQVDMSKDPIWDNLLEQNIPEKRSDGMSVRLRIYLYPKLTKFP
jgi:hypothetical protein